MPRHAAPMTWAIALLALLSLGALLSTAANPPAASAGGPAVVYKHNAEELLPGTWLREYKEEGVAVRRVLVMDAKGDFHEVSRIVGPGGKSEEFVNEGTWVFDGTNLMRRYASINGQTPTALTMPFVTFEIAFQSRNEFAGVDHIHGHNIVYQRVAPETEP